jgi:16S rRNA (cytosine1402-N4)-methyltransferase
MTGRSTLHEEDVAGGPARHVPVMLDEVLSALAPRPGSAIVDGTFGAGGYTSALLDLGSQVIAIDRDPSAIRDGQALVARFPGRLHLIEGEFARLDAIARENGMERADGVVLDIGVSSMQLDEAERGFSFRRDGPLDMRMAASGPTAADVVNHAGQKDLLRIIGILGEERHAPRVARAIAERRIERPFERTLDLAAVVEKAVGRSPADRIHPATRTFQGLRIFVNRELEQLAAALSAAERLLAEGGRLVVVTFHSLEDRIVKRFLQDRASAPSASRHLPDAGRKAPSFAFEKRGALAPDDAEMQRNPRARSAKLRYAIRTAAAAFPEDWTAFKLPDLVEIQSLKGAHGHA